MAAPHNGNAKGGSSLDRFLIRAIIALAFLMIGVVLGFSLAVFAPDKWGEPGVAGSSRPEAEPLTQSAEIASAESQGSQAAESPESAESQAAESPESPGNQAAESLTESKATESKAAAESPESQATESQEAAEGEAEADSGVEPSPGVEPPPMSGNLIVEVRDVTGEARSKGDIRAVVKQHGHEFEACIVQHGPGLEQARMHFQFYVTPDGKVAGTLLLQGINPELDACVGQAVAGWNFGTANANSFFKIKLVWGA